MASFDEPERPQTERPSILRADILRSRYLEELIASTRLLESFETAAVAEAWASSAVAEWAALGGAEAGLAAHLEPSSPLGAALVGWIDGGDAPDVGADWVEDAGAHHIVRVVRLIDPTQPSETGWIFEFAAPSGARHDLSATIVDDVLVGLSIGPQGLALAAAEDDASGFVVEEASAEDAVADIERCLASPFDTLSESAEATLPLLMRRLHLSVVGGGVTTTTDRVIPARDVEDDVYAADLIRSALRTQRGDPAPEDVDEARRAFAGHVVAGDTDALTLFEVAGEPVVDQPDLDCFVRLVGAYLAPVDLASHSDPAFAALVELEPADWTGVVLGMARAAVGIEVDGDALVTFVNRAPEITTTIPKRDAPRIAWTFEQMLYAWEVTGVLDSDGCVTGAARWLLPNAALAVWRSGQA